MIKLFVVNIIIAIIIKQSNYVINRGLSCNGAFTSAR